jgi:predicted transcriptional regulator YheO
MDINTTINYGVLRRVYAVCIDYLKKLPKNECDVVLRRLNHCAVSEIWNSRIL